MQPTGERPILRYFAARGRAQPLRHALADAGVHFEDVRAHADEASLARADALVSAVYVDVMVPAGELIWADLLWPGSDLPRAVPAILGRMVAKLGRVERGMRPSGGVSGNERPRPS